MTNLFAGSFVRDLMKGLVYLHDSQQIAHGQLNSDTCLISQYWSLKLSDFGLNDVMYELAVRDEVHIALPDINGW